MQLVRGATAMWALLAAAVVFLVLWLPGCRRTSAGDRIDVAALQRQMDAVIGLQLMAAHFYNRRIAVSCSQTGSDGLHYSCHVFATNPTLPTQSWFENVTCDPPGDPDVPRCFSDHGEALQ
jgi:hypothetical protein